MALTLPDIMSPSSSVEDQDQSIGQVRLIITGALLLVAGNSWSDFISTLVNNIFPNDKKATILAKLIYALLVTIVCIFALKFIQDFFKINFIQNLAKPKDTKETKETKKEQLSYTAASSQ
jgi:phosphotransferase system  glucose/maltose/N-acetylglucosamine-specific IIC component